jgi:protein O-mannosyl-transferase
MFTRSRCPLESNPPTVLRRRSWTAPGLLVVMVLLAYAGSINAPFVYDDTLAIPENQTIRSLWPLKDVLWPQLEGGVTVSGRPVLNLSFAINHAISGTNVWSYHVFNILVHAASACLLFGLTRRTFVLWRPRLGAASLNLGLGVAALWSLHPLLTQAVTYTVQRAESLMGFFYLLTLYSFVRGAIVDSTGRRGGSRWFILSVAACVLGMGTKEVMASAPLIVLLYDRTFLAGSFFAAWRSRRGYYACLAGTWLVLAALVLSTGGNRGGTVGLGTGLPLWAYPFTQFQAISRYLGLAVWPHPLVFEYGTFWVKRAGDFLPHLLLVLPLLGGTILGLRRWPAVGFCGAWFFLILAPTSLAPGTIQMIVEHRMYLPLAAIVALAMYAAHRCLGRGGMSIALVASLALGILTYRRNHDYRSHLALWSDTVAKRPQNSRAHDGLAEAFTELGRLNDALAHRREAVRLKPDESTYHYNLALTLGATNQREEALREYERALQLAPAEARTHNNLAILHGEMHNEPAALAHYAEAVRLKPREPLYHYNHGVALLRNGQPADAATSFETAIQLRAEYPEAQFNLATAYVRLDRLDAALSHYAEAVRLKPADADYGTTFGGALLAARRPADALAEFRRVLAARPDAIEAALGVANALSALRRTNEAVTQYQAVLQREPAHGVAHFKLGNALLDLDQVARAAEHYTAALRITPDNAEAHHNLGVAYARLERWNDAREAFESALRLNPEYADAKRHLEQLKTMLGR